MGAPWALNGFYLSLGPSLAGEVFRSRNLLWGGLVIFLLTVLAGTAAIVVRTDHDDDRLYRLVRRLTPTTTA